MIINLIYRGFHFTLISKGYDMKKCLDFIAETEEQTITNRIAMINTYNVSKVAKQAPYPLSFDRFYDQILPLTKNAIADFKQLVHLSAPTIPTCQNTLLILNNKCTTLTNCRTIQMVNLYSK